MHDQEPTDLERITCLSRRGFIGMGALGAAAFFLGGLPLAGAHAGPARGSRLLGFDNIAASTLDAISLPPGYRSRVLISWGQPLAEDGPAFRHDGGNSAAEQLQQFGDNNDGMSFFPWPDDADRALMAINNEYVNYQYLLAHGGLPQSAEDVLKAQSAEGVTVIEVRRQQGEWRFVSGSPYNRRIHGNTPIGVSGPARGHALLRTAVDPQGIEVLGTFQNCSSGQTPWGTYLTCEENFTDCFGSSDPQQVLDADQKCYSVTHASVNNDWHRFDPRFDIARNPNELHRHGWIVEIDPFDPQSRPLKRTALGRFKHENAALASTRDGRVVVYMGDDERGEFIYKFVSRDRLQPGAARANRDILDHGTLYVASFDAGDGDRDQPRGRGRWIELSHGRNGLTEANGFASQAEVLIRARQAGRQVGATRMDRPEWIAVSPHDGQVYCTLTNNSKRGEDGQPVAGPNPRANNLYGQILRWREDGDDAAAHRFDWDLFIIAGNPVAHPDSPNAGSRQIDADNMFNSPDGLGFDRDGRLWVLTDGKYSNSGDYVGMGNNQMLCADPQSGEIRRFMVGPVGCEVTGLAFAADYRTLFVGIQHPGEEGGSGFPDHVPGGRPRSSVLAITRTDGGVIGA
ncbi:PhoX family protein [Stutzerimonas kirkiae]|uniref:Transcriptional initiation protein Tat n=1 Tax=Stutzerimonas kirkiae TaxID=2211392 RepID=A0A4Q9R906_9GAMM|nr:PhoX family phosphatase [Stutzerimonas kirkiae]TBU96570.1 transcriptional initiation protein Tat [Stutzerimonas kirkiae]TBV02147.1 transcriptional initiation protein Tat [Stutzerimonas kirkiae]TBV08816.1 transcriptional initiation protein Tat [Stutzerimonas kirkiae]TBV15651.1 transcriptional initiation protein Tat [Stutzerimonas kirkiae]